MEINSTKKRNFFDVELEVTHPINPCRGNATITCHYGNQKVEVLNQYIDDCKGIIQWYMYIQFVFWYNSLFDCVSASNAFIIINRKSNINLKPKTWKPI